MECILQEIESSKEAVLRQVDFSDIRMTGIRAELLKNVTRLEEFTTDSEAKLTRDQLRIIFTEIVENERNQLRVLKVPGNNLSGLRPGLVAAAVEKLVRVDLEATTITDLAGEIFSKERAHSMSVWGPTLTFKTNL